MSWETFKLSDCCVSITDGDHLPPPKADSGIPFVTISNINTINQFDFTNTMFVPQDYYDKLDSKRKAQIGDVLYSVVGSFGIPVYIKDNRQFVFQRHIAILRPNEKILPRFLYYTMLSRDFYAKADAVAVGAAQRTVGLSSLRNIKIDVPTIDEQNKIVNILSAYDDLIENNQKQIDLLEETAQRLYKEWFVDLRFPGYENTPIVDGVPEGWTCEAIDNVYSIKYGKNLPTTEISDTGEYPVYGASKKIGYYSQKNCDNYAVLITSRGNAGVVHRTHNKESFVTNNSFIVLPKIESLHNVFVFFQMKQLNFKSIVTGACQQQLTNGLISKKSVVVPTADILTKFNAETDSLFELVEILMKQNECLIETRDRLLPKLMSGELEV